MIHVPWTQQPPVGTPLNMGHPLTQGLVGCWPLNEGSGSIAKDYASNKSATVTNVASWSTSKQGMAITSNASGKGVTQDHSTIYDSSSYTFVIKIQFLSVQNIQGSVFMIRQGTSPYYLRGLWVADGSTAYSPGKKLVASNGNAQGGGAYYYDIYATNDFVVDTKPHTIAMVCKYGEYIRLYSDGIKLSTTGIRSVWATSVSAAAPITIGAETALNWNPNAMLSDALYYNRALSDSEIASLYANPYQIFQPITLYNPLYIAAYNYWCKVGGTWEQALDMFVKINGGWQKATDIPKVKVGGTWI